VAYLNSQVKEDQSVDSDDLLYEARLIKTPWEIDMLRMAAQHMERVQSIVAQQLEPGMNALALDTMIMAAGWAEDKEHSMQGMSYQIGIGPYWGVSQSPRNYVIKKGDLMRIDGGGTHFGYISDITRTWAVGGSPSSKHEETYDALYAGFQKGLTLLKPGVKMSEMYAEVRAEVEKSPIFPNYARGHVGHSISLNPLLEDHPLFAPGFDVEFQPGMCVSLETSYMAAQGAYAPGPYNIEDSFAITEDGYDRFTTVPDSLVWDGTPTVDGNNVSGVGDIVQSFFFSPKEPTKNGWIWGVGPVLSIPIGKDEFTADQWGAGPTFVALKQQGRWTYGALLNHVWGIDAPSDRESTENSFLQPFVAYVTPNAWTFNVLTESSYDWNTEQWTVPVIANVSKLTHIGKQPVSFQVGYRHYFDAPAGGPDWGLRFAVTLLFPK
jgi:methionine aminopeptidase